LLHHPALPQLLRSPKVKLFRIIEAGLFSGQMPFMLPRQKYGIKALKDEYFVTVFIIRA